MPKVNFRLYLITDRRQTLTGDLATVIHDACQAGVKAIQLREKDLTARELFSLAANIQSTCRTTNTKLFINERADIAHALDLDGVQLTSRSFPVQAARKILAPEKLIGVSTHSLNEASLAEKDGSDFLLFGPVFPTLSKYRYGKPQGLEKLKDMTRKTKIPVFAVGGITPERALKCVENGAFGVAVISAIMKSQNIGKKVEEFETYLSKL